MDIPFNIRVKINKKDLIGTGKIGEIRIGAKCTPLFIVYSIIAGKFLFMSLKELLKLS